jgi:phage terminase large subunit
MAIKLLSHQLEFITSNYRHTGLVGGFRSGKSHSGVIKTIAKKLKIPRVDVAYYLPTYSLIKDIAFPKFSEILTAQNIPFTINKSDKDIITPYGRIICRSMDNPDLIIGYEVGYSLVDEADVPSTKKMQETMIKILARNSVKTEGNNNATDFVSTPEGFKFLYNFFVKNKSENKKLIQARTEDNPFISEDYIDSLKEQYTQQQLEAYLNGEFVNLTSGTVYHAFNRQVNHSDREIQPRDVLHVGMDFNITKMSAVVHVTDAKIVTSVEEITNAYDTAEMISIIKVRYPKHKIVVYPDASGNARNTAGDSDIKLLRKAKFTVRVDKSNPSVRDRITSVNSAFKNSKGETTYYVNTNNCIDYTEALEKLPYKNGVPDKESGFDHVTDGGGYALYQINKGKNTIRINV